MENLKCNKKNKNDSWTLNANFLQYKREGGTLTAEGWNSAIKEQKINEKLEKGIKS